MEPNQSTEKPTLTEARYNELLRMARKSRLFWVLQGRDGLENKLSPSPIASSKAASSSSLPAAHAIQQVLDYLTDAVGDGNLIDVESLVLGMEEDVDETALLEAYKHPDNTNLSSYDLFLKKLIHPHAGPVVKSMQQFVAQQIAKIRDQRMKATASTMDNINNILKAASLGKQNERDSEESAKIWANNIFKFLDHVADLMRTNILWAADTDGEFQIARENSEKFIFIKLHNHIFGVDSEDYHQNQQTQERIASLSFISAEHLDIKSFRVANSFLSPSSSTHTDPLLPILSPAVKFLQDLESAKSPADKMQCIRKCSASIAQILRDLRTDNNLPGADELLPTMILTLKLCNPPMLHSQIKFLQRYTRPEKLTGEGGYLLTNFVSAVYFLDHVNAQALTIEPEEFDRAIAQSKQRGRQQVGSAAKRGGHKG
ncbi:hypothetical protein EON64_12205, partial [archaeon]